MKIPTCTFLRYFASTALSAPTTPTLSPPWEERHLKTKVNSTSFMFLLTKRGKMNRRGSAVLVRGKFILTSLLFASCIWLEGWYPGYGNWLFHAVLLLNLFLEKRECCNFIAWSCGFKTVPNANLQLTHD